MIGDALTVIFYLQRHQTGALLQQLILQFRAVDGGQHLTLRHGIAGIDRECDGAALAGKQRWADGGYYASLHGDIADKVAADNLCKAQAFC